jgi:hypothetical protein
VVKRRHGGGADEAQDQRCDGVRRRGGVLAQEPLDSDDELAARGFPTAGERRDLERERVQPARPSVQLPGGSLGEAIGAPGAVSERVGEFR